MVEPLQPVDGREAGFLVVENEKLPYTKPQGAPVGFFGSRSGHLDCALGIADWGLKKHSAEFDLSEIYNPQSVIHNHPEPLLSRATQSKGPTGYAARSSRRNTTRLMGGTGRSLQPFSSASTPTTVSNLTADSAVW